MNTPTTEAVAPARPRRPDAAPHGAEIVSFQGVSKSFGAVKAVQDLTFSLRAGETVALLGPNGAGKSTSFDLLFGLREADRGRISLFGGTPRQAITAGRVGAMLQSGGLMPEVTVREQVQLACDLHPRAYPVREVLATAGITDIADRKVDRLSGGQTQRVRFALATAGDSDLIVLDEPTTGMDVTARQGFWSVMKAQAEAGRTVLFATHYLEEADSVADRVLVLHKGRLLADGTAAEIKARAGLRKVSFDLDHAPDRALLERLPAVAAMEIGDHTVRIRSTDADATVAAVYAAGLYPRGLEVTGLGLEQAFLAITGAADAAEDAAGVEAEGSA